MHEFGSARLSNIICFVGVNDKDDIAVMGFNNITLERANDLRETKRLESCNNLQSKGQQIAKCET